MKIFTNKNLIQKIIIAFVCVILLEFSLAPNTVKAETSFGGELMGAMRDFITAVADVAISVIQLGLTGEWSFAVDEKGSGDPVIKNGYFDEKDDFRYPIIQISPELIFSNQIRLLDVNFIRGGSRSSYLIDSEKSQTAIDSLRKVIASWYVTLRTIAIVGLLSVLIYIGIRIIISSTSQDRAKYKQRLMDWIIAFCLLFFMHYIMAGVLGAVDRFNNALSKACGLGNGETEITGIDLNSEYGGVKYVNPSRRNEQRNRVIDFDAIDNKIQQYLVGYGYNSNLLQPKNLQGDNVNGASYSVLETGAFKMKYVEMYVNGTRL